MRYAYFTGTSDAAIWGAELASGKSKQPVSCVRARNSACRRLGSPGFQRSESGAAPHRSGARAAHQSAHRLRSSKRGPAPLGFAGFLARREARSCMERCTRRIYVRVTDADLARAKALAEGTGLSVSDLVRLLLRLPAGDAATQRADVLDALAQTKNTLDTVRRATGPLASSVRSVAESRILFL